MTDRRQTRQSNAARAWRREDGAAMVEFALVLPLLLVLLFGMLEFGRALNYWLEANHLANGAARWAVVDKNPGASDGQSLQEYVLEQGDTAEFRDAAQVCIEFPDGSAEVGDPVKATVDLDFGWLPLVADVLGATTTTLNGSATMRLEHEPSAYTNECS